MPRIQTSRGVIKYKTYPLYVGIKQIDKEKAKINLLLLKKICERNNIPFGLIGGTLLGAVREHDFITHDEDIDIFILDESKTRFFDVLFEFMDSGFAVARYDRRGLLSLIKNNEYIDVYFFSKHINKTRICSGWCVPEKYLLNTCQMNFQGELFFVPEFYMSYLEFEYGKGWNVPVAYTDFNISKIKIFLFKTRERIKDLLPDFLYFKLAKNKERKMELFYMSKCLKEL